MATERRYGTVAVSKTKRRVFDPEFKLSALKRYVAGESATTICRELQIRRSLLSKWGAHFGQEGPEGFRRAGRPRKSDEAGALDAMAKATRDKLGALEWIAAANKRTDLPICDEAGLAVV